MLQQGTTGTNSELLQTVKFDALLILACLIGTSTALADHGVIRGVAVNGSRDQLPTSGATVILRARLEGQFIAVQETTTDSRGTFRFEGLPIDPEIQYIAGANLGEVHFPGPRLRLTSDHAQADVKIVVHESVAEPNPLVIRQHDILVQPRAGAMEVTETLLIDNPSNVCYVGKSSAGADRIVTLRLSIPPDFNRITFEKEFFGRRFLLIDGKLLTGIPWPPGRRQLKFTYVLADEKRPTVWQRSVDLPCSHLQLTVNTDRPADVQCDLKALRTTSEGAVSFSTTGAPLPTGYEICLQLGSSPIPIMAYGRWTAIAVLGALVYGTSVFMNRPKRPRDG